ncbi:hypothetical protein AB1Y20_011805 [Prymnesium parvum]|uniref:Phytanoyl-CoA dioxygenase n=1 Tax=Prymnesium parvum TaxID=97485 RepID=A0AB34IK64_PRYPA
MLPLAAAFLSMLPSMRLVAEPPTRLPPVQLSGLGPASLDPLPAPGSASTLLFEDQKRAMSRQANRERELLEPRTQPLAPPARRPARRRGAANVGAARGFGQSKATAGVVSSAQDLAHAEAVEAEGVCYVPSVLAPEEASVLLQTVREELASAYAAVETDSECSVARFNVPVETHDPNRGYLLLPLRDEASAAEDVLDGPFVQSLRKLLAPDSKLGQLFSLTCGGGKAELYDVVALRTEAGAARQPIHFDTPYQKVAGLFCAFVALQDVRYSMGVTVFIPGTHKNNAERRAFELGQSERDNMLAKAQPRYAKLCAGDAVFFDMRTLHAGTANFPPEEGGGQRLLLALTFRNLKAREALGHAPNLRPGYRHRGITLAEVQAELGSDAPFAGVASDGKPYGDGLQA